MIELLGEAGNLNDEKSIDENLRRVTARPNNINIEDRYASVTDDNPPVLFIVS